METPNVISPTPVSAPKTRLLLGIDFDMTIPSGHLNNTVASSGETEPDKQWELVKDIKPLGNEGEWKQEFKEDLKAGHYIAIVTCSAYPHIIKRYLTDVLNLDPSFFEEKIKIIAFNHPNKNAHLERALQEFNLPPDFAKKLIILVDDDQRNLYPAMSKGYQTIHATPNGKHIGKLRNCILKTCEENDKKLSASQNAPEEDLLAVLLANSTTDFHENVRNSRSPSPEPRKISITPPKKESAPDVVSIRKIPSSTRLV